MIFFYLCLISLSGITFWSIHVASNDIISFFFTAHIPLYICIASLSIPLSIDILGCFHVLAVMNTSMCWCCKEHWGVYIFTDYGFLQIHVQEWDFRIICKLYLVFKLISILLSIVVVPIYIPSNSIEGFPFLYTLQHCLYTIWLWPFWAIWSDTSV